jgi:glycosyltransferase involved in cell wall biosynthesis
LPTPSEPASQAANEPRPCCDITIRMLASLRGGRRQAALELAGAITEAEPANLHSLALAGRVLELAGSGNGQAEALYRRMMAAAPALIYPRHRLCEVLLKSGQTVEAAELAAKLVAQAPGNPRILDLEKRVTAAATGAGFDLWRRWFAGEASSHEGSRIANAPMAVVVIGFRSQPTLLQAVESLLEQDEPAEIVVVNSGGGDAETLLARYAARIRLIHIQAPLYAGAARNIGIDASSAHYVAFLEGDCLARPGWVRLRRAAHERGARAVASAIVPPDQENDLSLAAHLCLFGARSPEIPPTQALRYGVSYDRQVFAEFGYFNPTLRISEDTNLARRLGRHIHPAWDPRVQTEHGNPPGRCRFWFEMIGRGRRAARYQPASDRPSPWQPAVFRELLAAARQRTATALHIADTFLRLELARQTSIRNLIRPASLAYGAGNYLGLVAIHRARRLRQESRRLRALGAIPHALRHAEKALEADPANLAVRLELVDLLLARGGDGDSAKTEGHLDVAMWQSAFHDERLAGMADWLIERNMVERAWRLGEIATFSLPSAFRIHERLARAAQIIGDAAAFELAAFDAAARDPAAAAIRPRLDALYEASARALT